MCGEVQHVCISAFIQTKCLSSWLNIPSSICTSHCCSCFLSSMNLLFACVLGLPVLCPLFFLFYIYFPDSLTMTQQNLPPPPVKWQTRLSRMDWRRLHVSEQTDDALAYSISRVEPRGSSKLLEDGTSLRGFLNNNFRLDIMSFT